MELSPTPAGLEVVQGGLELAEPKSEPITHFGYEKGNVCTNQTILSPHVDIQKQSRSICGLLPTTFLLSMALVLVILLAGIGGGVGGTVAVNNARKAQSRPQPVTASQPTSPSTTTTSPIALPTTNSTGFLPLDCPSLTNTRAIIQLENQTWTFLITCGTDTPGSDLDIIAIIAYSLHDCAQACASYNRNTGQNTCKGATFNAELAATVASNYGTCFLKNRTASPSLSGNNWYAGLKLEATS